MRLTSDALPRRPTQAWIQNLGDSFVKGIRDWEVQLLVCMHSCKNIITALAYALEVEAARRASRRPALVHQLRGECLKIPCFRYNKEGHYQVQCPVVQKAPSTEAKKPEN